jgi:hypothetical protein
VAPVVLTIKRTIKVKITDSKSRDGWELGKVSFLTKKKKIKREAAI